MTRLWHRTIPIATDGMVALCVRNACAPASSFDEAREETDNHCNDSGAQSCSAGGSRIYIDTCTRCAEQTAIDSQSLLCVPCEADTAGIDLEEVGSDSDE